MTSDKISKRILEKIQQKDIKPIAKWEFLFKEYFIWTIGLASFIFGSFAVAVIIYMVRYNDWGIYKNLNNSLLEFIVLTLPYFWIVILLLFVWLVNFNIKHTKKGYKYSYKIVLLISILASILVGAILYGAGVGQAMDDLFSKNVPFYKHLINRKIDMWSRPENGLLIGVVHSRDNGMITLVDIRSNYWNVDTDEAEIAPVLILTEGEKLKILGRIIEESLFEAHRIFPMGPGRGCFENERCFMKNKTHEQCRTKNECPFERNIYY